METNTLIAFPHVAATLESFASEVLEHYRSYLVDDNSIASGKLHDDITFRIDSNGRRFDVVFTLQDYWKFVEYGRAPGKMPPPSKILEWIRIKPVIPRPGRDGRIPTQKSLAFLIARAIGRDGIEPKPQLKPSVETALDNWRRSVAEAVAKDVKDAVSLSILSNIR